MQLNGKTFLFATGVLVVAIVLGVLTVNLASRQIENAKSKGADAGSGGSSQPEQAKATKEA